MLKNVAMALGLVLAIGFVYYPVAQHGFVSFDDRVFITENPHVKAGLTPDGLRWALTSTEQGTWHPLTWLSLMLDCQWFGLNAGPHHLMSVLLHAISTVLLFYVLVSMTGRRWPSAVVAALFALHPLHVESVAWASERKDTLSTVFWMLTLLAYVGYVRRPGLVRYAAVFVALALGLMSKPMLVTLPFVLLLLDFWPLGRTPWAAPARVEDPSQTRRGGPWRAERDRPPWRTVPRLVLEKVPLFALVAAASAATYLTQNSEGAMKFAGRFPPMFRYAGAAVAYVEYVRQTFWPTGLAYFYPFEFHPLWKGLAAAIALAVVTALVLWQLRRRPYLAVGWFWYVGTLIPVAGFIQIGSQARADRYTYVPLIGVFVAVVWGVADALAGWRHRAKILAPLAACAVVACAIVAWQQVQRTTPWPTPAAGTCCSRKNITPRPRPSTAKRRGSRPATPKSAPSWPGPWRSRAAARRRSCNWARRSGSSRITARPTAAWAPCWPSTGNWRRRSCSTASPSGASRTTPCGTTTWAKRSRGWGRPTRP
jgi:hypothetical protein